MLSLQLLSLRSLRHTRAKAKDNLNNLHVCETLLHFKVELNFVLESSKLHAFLLSGIATLVEALGLRGSKPSKRGASTHNDFIPPPFTLLKNQSFPP